MTRPTIHGMRLHFPWARVSEALAEARAASEIRALYGAETGPGLWLVGDDRVYLMPNTAAKARTIVYPRECDPTKFSFDTWWASKRASFGGGDGVELIDIQNIDRMGAEFLRNNKKPQYFCVDISEEKTTIAIM